MYLNIYRLSDSLIKMAIKHIGIIFEYLSSYTTVVTARHRSPRIWPHHRRSRCRRPSVSGTESAAAGEAVCCQRRISRTAPHTAAW